MATNEHKGVKEVGEEEVNTKRINSDQENEDQELNLKSGESKNEIIKFGSNSKGKGKAREINVEEFNNVEGILTMTNANFQNELENQLSPSTSTHNLLQSRSTSPSISTSTTTHLMSRDRSKSPSVIEQPIASTSTSSTSNNSTFDSPLLSSPIASSSSIKYQDIDQLNTNSDIDLQNSSTNTPINSLIINREVNDADEIENDNNIIIDLGGKNKNNFNSSNIEAPKSNINSTHNSPSHSISSNSTSNSPNGTLTRNLRESLPHVISLLTCQSCKRLLKDPTTLVCGHSICLSCSLPTSSLRPDNNKNNNNNFDQDQKVNNGISISSSESQFSRNPSIPITSSTSSTSSISTSPSTDFIGPLQPNSSSSSSDPTSISSIHSSRSNVASIARGRPMCPYESCKGKEKVTTLAEPKLDFVLQKVLAVLNREIGGLAEEVITFGSTTEDDSIIDTQHDNQQEVRPSLKSMPGGSEFSLISDNGGGGEDPSDDESKRVHRSPTWTSSKRMRRKSLATKSSISLTETRLDRLEDLFDFKLKSTSLLVELQSELECQVCYQTFYNPITTPCGHTYCQKCLARSLDHSDKCAFCRQELPSFTHFQSSAVSSTTSQIISLLFPTLVQERKIAIEAEERSTSFDTPIFVCTLAWPNLPTYIHIFEPRYRLMMRRVMENGRKFGMVLPSRNPNPNGPPVVEYGTMLEVQSWNMIEDGRSIVECIGSYRFRLLEKDTLDGYTVGRVERVDDISQEQEFELERIALARNPPNTPRRRPGQTSISLSPPPVEGEPISTAPATPTIELSTTELMDICLEFIQNLRNGSAPWVLQRLNNTIGPMPTTNVSDFSFWMAEVMPVDDHVKATLLQITSPRERLRLLVFWIEQFKSSWWFASGCSVM